MIVVFILNDFFVPNIDVVKNTGTCGDQMISKDECDNYSWEKHSRSTLITGRFHQLYPRGCFSLDGVIIFNGALTSTNALCSGSFKFTNKPFSCICSKGKSDIN